MTSGAVALLKGGTLTPSETEQTDPRWPAVWKSYLVALLWALQVTALLVALIYVGGTPNVAPVTVSLVNLVGSEGQNYQLLTAAAFFSMIVPLVVFLSLQRYFVRGILAGSVKG